MGIAAMSGPELDGHQGPPESTVTASAVRVRFGPGPADDMPLAMAEHVLGYVRDTAIGVWANAMLDWHAPGFRASRKKQRGGDELDELDQADQAGQ
jgi:hypothetical protein